MITPEQLDAAERRYAPAIRQTCQVCGAPLKFSSSEGGRDRYNCSSPDASPLYSDLPYREQTEHYRRSAWFDDGQADELVEVLVRYHREMAGKGIPEAIDDAVVAELRQVADQVTGKVPDLKTRSDVHDIIDARIAARAGRITEP